MTLPLVFQSFLKSMRKIGISFSLVFMLTYAHADLLNAPLFMEPVKTEIFSKPSNSSQQAVDEPIDFVLVRKKERKLYLYANNQVIKSYTIALGKEPTGQKVKEGDSRTPEGLYTLDWRNPDSKFYKSIHISYPSAAQAQSAQQAGINPGGEIMIHGQASNWAERIRLTFADKDWTEGCIALENPDMLEIWNMVGDSTPIKIEP